jgi:soluble lytic murein transglycosylase-like protein
MVLKPAFLIATLLTASTVAAHPKIYTYVDATGTRHYTDVPDNNRYRLLVLSPQDRTASGDRYDWVLLAKAGQYDSIIEKAASSNSVEPNLIRAVIVVESGFNSHAVSKRGAVGLMQLMPATATRFGVSNLFDPRQNVHAGARYLKFLIDRFGQDVRLALAAYNAGEEAVERNGGQIPPFSETMAYVPRVLKIYQMLKDQPRATWPVPGELRPWRVYRCGCTKLRPPPGSSHPWDQLPASSRS